jgi:hypothetical protein
VDVDVVRQHVVSAAGPFWSELERRENMGRQDTNIFHHDDGGSTKAGSSKRQHALADYSLTKDSEDFAATESRYDNSTGRARKAGSRNHQDAVTAARKA